MDVENTDVLVVGAGPAGVSAALFLAKLGVDAITITKYAGHANSPRAHITNQRTMEIFRDQGVEEELISASTPQRLMTNVCWMRRFSEQEIVRFEAWGGGRDRRADYERAGPSSMCNLPQHILEPIVSEHASRAGADIRFGWELVDFDQDDDGVTAKVKLRDSGEERTIRAKYMIGADGGNSMVASKLGIEMQGQRGLGAAVTAWIECDLTEFVEDRPSVLYWVVQPGGETWLGTGCYVAVKPWTEWMLLFVVPADEEPDLTPETIGAQVRQHVGENVDVRVKGQGRWLVNQLIAEQYQVGRVFLAGDAAHRHPPANGLGSNTSIQDSYNLCWKLAMVLSGQAGAGLLKSYAEERRPVGEQVVKRAITSMGNLVPVMEGLAKGGVNADGDVDLEGLFASTESGEERRSELFDALDLQNWHFNALGVEIGQHYRSSAIAAEGQERPDRQVDRELYDDPSTTPGCRLPHVRLRRDRADLSTLDLVGKGRFTLLVGAGGAAWQSAARKVSQDFGLDIAVEEIGLGLENADVFGEWAKLCGVSANGAILVRPDAHIAWRSIEGADNPTQALGFGLQSVLSLQDARNRATELA